MKKIVAFVLSAVLCAQPVLVMSAADREVICYEEAGGTTSGDTEENKDGGPEVAAPSAILMEASTGKVIYEKNPDEQKPPASVTKVMTMLLIFDALEEGKIGIDDEVTVSEYAASMGGSQVFLEAGETQSVDTMLKCIAVSSANDACVAMAEHLWGSEEEFVNRMNRRAKELGMENTNFVNCNGLDTEGHVTTARDIALMSRELITRYPQVREYVTIWMDMIIHKTKKGESEFGLANTNKLIRQYAYATGLKTGSTADAGFCVSATAEKNQMEMIAVILGDKDSKTRFKDAAALLDYGFGRSVKYVDDGRSAPKPVEVKGGQKERAKVRQKEAFTYIDIDGADLSQVKKSYEPVKFLKTPVKEGDAAGNVIYTLNGEEIGRAELIAAENVKKATFESSLIRLMERFFLA